MNVTFTAQEFAQLEQVISVIPTGHGWQAAYLLTLVKQKNEVLAKQAEEKVQAEKVKAEKAPLKKGDDIEDVEIKKYDL